MELDGCLATVAEIARMRGLPRATVRRELAALNLQPVCGTKLYDLRKIRAPHVKTRTIDAVPAATIKRLICKQLIEQGYTKEQASARWSVYLAEVGHRFPELFQGAYRRDVAKALLIDAGRAIHIGHAAFRAYQARIGSRHTQLWQLYHFDWNWMLRVPLHLNDPCGWVQRQYVPHRYMAMLAHIEPAGITILRPYPNDEFAILVSNDVEKPLLPGFVEAFFDEKQHDLRQQARLAQCKARVSKRFRPTRDVRERLRGRDPAQPVRQTEDKYPDAD